MKIQHLRYFAAVVDHGGVVRASERLHMTQPSVSAGLKALEHELGCALFERGAGRLRLTPTGARFYKRAVEILRQCDAAKAEATGPASMPLIRIGIATTLSDRQCTAFALDLGETISAQKATFRAGAPDRLAQWLKQGRIDVALTVLDEAEVPERAMLLLREPFVCLVAEAHPFAELDAISIRQLAGEPFVTRPQCERHRAAQAIFRAEHMVLNVVYVSENDAGAVMFVRNGLGVTVAPLSLSNEGLRPVTVFDLQLDRSLYLVWRPDLPEVWIDAVTASAKAVFGQPS